MKKLMLICAPVTSRSGYGDHARDLVRAFFKHNKYKISILDVPWGDCPRNALDSNDKRDVEILNAILDPNAVLKHQPDVYVDIRIPNEFQTVGKFNIGITAGIETTAVSQAWLDGCNKMDLVIVPSEHAKIGFAQSAYEKVQQAPDGTQHKVGELKLEKPIEVLFEGADEDIYKPLTKDEIDSDFFDMLNEKVPEKFAFLFVGMWGKGGYGEDRKDIGRMLKVFYESFANKKKQPALILKTSGASFSVMDKEDCLTKIRQVKSRFPDDWKLPNVYLLHGELSDNEMNYLYNHPKVKCMVSFTHGEGFGRPLLEATMTGLPVIASGWSGQIDFLNDEYTILLPGTLGKVPKSARWKDIIIKESEWFTIDENEAYKVLNHAYTNSFDIKANAKKQMSENIEKFDTILESYLSSAPTQVSLNLPKLKKVEDKSEKIEKVALPKLKKVNKSEKSEIELPKLKKTTSEGASV